jgi:hypothetical protein
LVFTTYDLYGPPGLVRAFSKKPHELRHGAVGVGRKRLHRHEARRDVVGDAFLERQGIAVGFLDGKPRAAIAGLLERHADGPVVSRVRIAVAGVEEVEVFAREVQPAVAVEFLPVGVADEALKLALPGRDVRVDGLAGGVKK